MVVNSDLISVAVCAEYNHDCIISKSSQCYLHSPISQITVCLKGSTLYIESLRFDIGKKKHSGYSLEAHFRIMS